MIQTNVNPIWRQYAGKFMKTDAGLDRQWRWWAAFLLCFFCIQATLVAEIGFPRYYPDSHWRVGLNQAMAEGLVFGREVIFSYGPLSNVFSGMYHPEVYHTSILGAFHMGCVYMVVMWVLGRSLKPEALIAVTLVCVFCFYPYKQSGWLGIIFYGGLAAMRLNSSGRKMTATETAQLVFIFSSLGLAYLIKTNLTIMSAFVTVFLGLYFLIKKNWLAAAVVIVSPTVTAMGLWVVIGQPLSALLDYTLITPALVSGYTEAMQRPAQGFRLAAFILTALTVAFVVWRQSRPRPIIDRLALLVLFSSYMFLSFKGHFILYLPYMADVFGRTLIVAAMGAWLFFGGRQVLKFCLGLTVVVIPIFHPTAMDKIDLGRPGETPIVHDVTLIKRQFGRAIVTWHGFFFDRQGLDEKYKQTMAGFQERFQLPTMPGTSDLYTCRLSFMLAAGNTWNPRPVIQSYVAYTPGLAEINRQHLLNRETAPDNIFMDVATGWRGDMESVEDGASWPALLAFYEPVELIPPHLVLKRRAVEAPLLEPTQTPSFTASLDERVVLPETDEVLFMRFNLNMNWLGKFFKLIYKPQNLYLEMELDNGKKLRKRLVSARARSGYILNRVVTDSQQFEALYTREKTRNILNKVVAVTVRGPQSGYQHALWDKDFEVYIDTLPPYELDIAAETANEDGVNEHPAAPAN